MKRYMTGLITGVLLTTMIFIFMGTTQAQDDSLATIMTELDTYVQDLSLIHISEPTRPY